VSTFNWYDTQRKVAFQAPRIVESILATEAAEDWSRVRSPSRAKRRLKRGFPQNIRHYRKPACFFLKDQNTYHIHPDLMRALRHEIGERWDRQIAREFCSAIHGRL
jgi:hypothetical protein